MSDKSVLEDVLESEGDRESAEEIVKEVEEDEKEENGEDIGEGDFEDEERLEDIDDSVERVEVSEDDLKKKGEDVASEVLMDHSLGKSSRSSSVERVILKPDERKFKNLEEGVFSEPNSGVSGDERYDSEGREHPYEEGSEDLYNERGGDLYGEKRDDIYNEGSGDNIYHPGMVGEGNEVVPRGERGQGKFYVAGTDSRVKKKRSDIDERGFVMSRDFRDSRLRKKEKKDRSYVA